MASIPPWTTRMTPADKHFYQALGQRIARVRKAEGLTQQQLAEQLGIAQQTLAHYEGGHLRITVIMLASLAKTLRITVEELIEAPAPARKGKRGPASVLERKVEQIQQLPRAKQKFVMDMLDTVIQQQTGS